MADRDRVLRRVTTKAEGGMELMSAGYISDPGNQFAGNSVRKGPFGALFYWVE
jgi:hypothetical protein